MNKFNIIMDRAYSYEGDFIVGETDREYGSDLWLHIPYSDTTIKCEDIYIQTVFGTRVVKLKEKDTNKTLCYTKKGTPIADLVSYCVLNASNVTTQINKQHIHTEYEHFEEDIYISVKEIKLWDNEYIKISYDGWEGLWNTNKKAWQIISGKLFISVEKSDLGTSDLDYIKLTDKYRASKTQVILKGFRRVAFDKEYSINRVSEDLWSAYEYNDTHEFKYKLLRLKEDNSLEQIFELIESKTTKVNGVNMLTCELARGRFDIVDRYKNCLIAKPHIVIVLEKYPDRLYIDYGDIYEVTSETLHEDELTKCDDVERDGLDIYYKGETYTGSHINYSMIYVPES